MGWDVVLGLLWRPPRICSPSVSRVSPCSLQSERLLVERPTGTPLSASLSAQQQRRLEALQAATEHRRGMYRALLAKSALAAPSLLAPPSSDGSGEDAADELEAARRMELEARDAVEVQANVADKMGLE